jgi:hypothetical protein
MTKDEALQDLLFYLEQYRDGGALPPEIETALEKYEACRAALAEPAQEPVAFARLLHWIGDDVNSKGKTVARTYEECPEKMYPGSWQEGAKLYTAPQPQPLTVPQGYRLVPVEPTEEMVEAAFGALPNYPLEGNIRRHYRAMLAAAPEAPAVQPLTDAQKLDIVTNWFTDEADITRAMQMLIDFEQTTSAHGIKEAS